MTQSKPPQPAPSHAAPTHRVPEVGAATNLCWIYSNIDGLRVHRQPSTQSDVVGEISTGTAYWASCWNYPGGRYDDCGGGDQWVAVWLDVYKAWFYVALACVSRYGP